MSEDVVVPIGGRVAIGLVVTLRLRGRDEESVVGGCSDEAEDPSGWI